MILTDPQDLFLRELASIYAAEQVFAELIPEQAREVSNEEIRKLLVDHSLETQQQIKNLERVFKVLGMKPESTVCEVAEALRDEHRSFVIEEHPSQLILTMFDLDNALQAEHHEIAIYRSLVQKAVQLCEIDCIELLRSNLKQEEIMARRIEDLSAEFTRAAMDPVIA